MDTEKIAQALKDELSDRKYKLTFKSDGNVRLIETANYEKEISKVFGNVNEERLYFKMSVWNNRELNFKENPKYSQGEIVSSKNNTSFIYLVEVNPHNLQCRLGGYERQYYGLPPIHSARLFVFQIKDTAKEATGTTVPVKDKLETALGIIESIRGSGYIPCASPSPSSSEYKLKKLLDEVYSDLQAIIGIHKTLY